MPERRPPLLLHLVFHPESNSARQLARKIHLALNTDPVLPGLRIPTILCAEDGKGKPPRNQKLDRAMWSFVVPLADENMDAEESWCKFVGDLWFECQNSPHRCVPFQLSEYAYPLDERLSSVNFARVFEVPEDERENWVIRRLVTELCRFLHGDSLQSGSPEAPAKVFLSHTKLDLEQEPKVVETLKNYLQQDQPIKAWFDSGDIPSGSRFSKEIARGVEDSSLLCIRTDNYVSREWCRKEILLAKEKSRPIVVINALSGNEIRSFPYLGNVPEIRWHNNPEAAIDLILKETLRHLHSEAVMKDWSTPDDRVFIYPPEHITAIGMDTGTNVLYPDPPLGHEEIDTLTKVGVKAFTPLQRLAEKRQLQTQRIALSLSESTDMLRYGLDGLHLESAALELARYLLIKGTTLVYGGHLGSKGFTRNLFDLVATHNQNGSIDPVKRIENVVGWPLPLSIKDKSEYKNRATFQRIVRPEGIDESIHPLLVEEPAEFFPANSPETRFAWSKGMTAMRQWITKNSKARIVVGGTFGPTVKIQADGNQSESWYSSRIPGVLEEIVLSLQYGQPLFLIGAFGGVANLVIDILEGKERNEMSWDYQSQAPHAKGMRKIYADHGESWMGYSEIKDLIKSKGVRDLNPGLTVDEHRELFRTTDTLRMVEIVITGLNRLGSL